LDRLVPCVQTVPKGMPPFRRRVEFTLKSMEDEVQILIQGLTTQPTRISGMPKPLHQLVAAQGMQSPFGLNNHSRSERPLPKTPSKRKLHEL